MYRGAQGFVVVFDFSRKNTFENLEKWIAQIELHANVSPRSIIVLGNKKDMEFERAVTNKEVEDF